MPGHSRRAEISAPKKINYRVGHVAEVTISMNATSYLIPSLVWTIFILHNLFFMLN